jgi:hypothetical protein
MDTERLFPERCQNRANRSRVESHMNASTVARSTAVVAGKTSSPTSGLGSYRRWDDQVDWNRDVALETRTHHRPLPDTWLTRVGESGAGHRVAK